jgi:hypothetical protein
MANKRIFFAVFAAGIAGDFSVAYTPVHGLSSITVSTNFNLEQVFEIGQLNIYENIELIPDIEVTMEKVLDGYPPIYVLATKQGSDATLVGRSNAKCGVALSFFGDTQNAASGTPITEVEMSGMFVSSVAYNFVVDGNFTESVTLVGNDKRWRSSGYTFDGSLFNNADAPLALGPPSSGGVNRQEDFIFSDLTGTLLPAGNFGGIPGISSSGTNDKGADGQYGTHVTRVGVSATFGREPLNELGRKAPYFRSLSFPIEVSTDIEIISILGDQVGGTEEGLIPGSGNNIADKTIRVKTREGLTLDLGSRNKLSSVAQGGGDSTGGNVTNTFTYLTYNNLKVTHPQDPTGLN